MKRIFAANIIGIGAVLALGVAASANAAQAPQGLADVAPTASLTSSPSVSPSASPSPTVTETPTDEPTDESTVVTADIYFEINYAVDAPDAPLYSEVSGVEINDEVELPATNRYFDEGEDDFCTLPAVDIAADLSSVTVTGADERCGVQIAYLGITLHGANFGEVTLGADGLFGPAGEQELQLEGSGGGLGGLSNAVHFAVVDVPTVQEFGASGPDFEANWLGTGHGLMTGVTGFDFAVAADGAEPVAGEPNFTG